MRNIKKQRLKEGWEEIEEVLYWEDLPYVAEIVQTKLIIRYHDDSLAGHFGIEKI